MNSETRLVWSSKMDWERYLRPCHLSEALTLLEEYRDGAKIIAGGTDLLIQIRKREVNPRVLIDITQIPDLDRIKCEEGLIKIGALVTHHQVASSSLIREKALGLSQGASWVGSPQIRNMGTIGGNIVSGQPGADVTLPLLALNASVRVANKRGERTIPLSQFFEGPGKTVLDRNSEIATEILFPVLKEGETSLSLRLAKRKALALPILVASLVLSADLKKSRFNYVNIALGPVAPVPFRAREAEQVLASAPISEKVIKEAAQKAAQEANPRTNPLRGSGAYRKEMVAALVKRGLEQGLQALEVQHG